MQGRGYRLIAEKVSKLERRLAHQRALGASIGAPSPLSVENARVVVDMEAKLSKLKSTLDRSDTPP